MTLPEGFVIDEEIAPPPGFELDAPDEKSVSGFFKNAGKDAVDTVKGLGTLGAGLLTHPIDTSVNLVTHLPSAIVEEGKRIGLGGEGGLFDHGGIHPVNAINKFGRAMYDKPLTTTLDVLPAIGAAGKAIGIGGKVAKGAELAGEAGNLVDDAARTAGGMADDVSRVAERAPNPMGMPSEASQILKETPSPARPEAQAASQSVPTGSTFQETVANIGKKFPNEIKEPLSEVKTILESKYRKAAKTPGAVHNFGKALEQKGRGMTLKEIGGTPGMARTLRDRFGEGVLNELSDLAEKKGVTKGFFNWQTGNEIKNLMDGAGKKIGAIRDLAVKRGAIHDTDTLINRIRGELDPIYLKGSGSAQKGAYMKSLEDIKNAPKDPVAMANMITEKNRFLKKNRLTQPIGAGTDVLNEASRLNNELINKFLYPNEAATYKESLKDFSASKLYDKMYSHTYGRDMMGRSGPSSIWNTVKDIGGRKVMEKIFKSVGRNMQKNHEYLKNPAELTSDVIDSISSAVDEVIDQMGDTAK